jgi:hypothetical protein
MYPILCINYDLFANSLYSLPINLLVFRVTTAQLAVPVIGLTKDKDEIVLLREIEQHAKPTFCNFSCGHFEILWTDNLGEREDKSR